MPQPMHRRSVRWSTCVLLLTIVPSVGLRAQMVPAAAAPTRALPSRLTDAEFWALVSGMSEPGGTFHSDNFTSNEMTYPDVIARLTAEHRSGGAYVGVGPEQNFSYVAALHPDIAFIVDIRRQAAMQQLMYKAVFDLSRDRADFLALLFSKPRPAGLASTSTIAAIWDAYWFAPTDTTLFERNLTRITGDLTRTHGFALGMADRASIRLVYRAFYDNGPRIAYTVQTLAATRPVPTPYTTPAEPIATTTPMPTPVDVSRIFPNVGPPTMVFRNLIQGKVAGVTITRSNGYTVSYPSPLVSYYGGVNFASLTAAEDSGGIPRSFLASEAAYRSVRDLESRNLVVPVVGDFGGPTALRAVGSYLRNHGSVVSAFYVSNVEEYLFEPNGKFPAFYAFYDNAATLPADSSSVFIRNGASLCPMLQFLAAYRAGHVNQWTDAAACRH